MVQVQGSEPDQPDRPDRPAAPSDPSSRASATGDADVRDTLPADLDASSYVGPVTFPDNSRRRIPGYLYLGLAAVCVAVRVAAGDDAVLANDGFFAAALALAAFGAYCLGAGWPLGVDATEALVEASKRMGFPVGHASASLGWRGLRSRPTWRILLYSAEEPPHSRGLVLVDAVEGQVLEHFVEDNPEDWADVTNP